MANLKVFLFGNRGYASLVLEGLVERDIQVVGLCTRGQKPWLSRLRLRFGALRQRIGLVRGDLHALPGPFEAFASPAELGRSHGIPVWPSSALRTPEFREAMANLRPDVILIAGFHRLVPESIFSLARLTAVNFHPALLPRHRGSTPNRWVVRQGETHTGITAHLLTEEFDAGLIVGQRQVTVAATDTWGDVEQNISTQMLPFVLDILDAAGNGNLDPQPQDEDQTSYEPAYGGRLRTIDWNDSVEEIRRTCYAIRPKSGGLTNFGKKTLCVWEIAAAPIDQSTATPGTIMSLDNDADPIVKCGDGAARIESFIHGAKVVPAGDTTRRLGWRIGDRFGTDRSEAGSDKSAGESLS